MPATADTGVFDPSQPIKFRGLGLLGGLRYSEKAPFDDKISERSEYRFDGIKGGMAWKSTLEMYMSSKCPIVLELLK